MEQIEGAYNWANVSHTVYASSLRACLHGVEDPGLVGLVSFVFTLWGHKTKETYPTKPGSPIPCKQGLRACLHEGGGPRIGEVTWDGLPLLTCKHDHIKMRDYMDRWVIPPKRVTSPIWGTPPPCKQALIWQIYNFSQAANNQRSRHRVQRAGLLRRLTDERRDVFFGGRLKGMKSMRSIYFLIRR